MKLHEYGENATPECREGQEKEPRREGGGEGEPRYRSINKNKRVTRLKVRQAQPAYWAQNKQNDKMDHENA